jgi:hypothetical protein
MESTMAPNAAECQSLPSRYLGSLRPRCMTGRLREAGARACVGSWSSRTSPARSFFGQDFPSPRCWSRPREPINKTCTWPCPVRSARSACSPVWTEARSGRRRQCGTVPGDHSAGSSRSPQLPTHGQGRTCETFQVSPWPHPEEPQLSRRAVAVEERDAGRARRVERGVGDWDGDEVDQRQAGRSCGAAPTRQRASSPVSRHAARA